MTQHHDEIMAKMPEFCEGESSCFYSSQRHWLGSECPMYQRELRKLQMEDQWEFTDALKALPKHDLNVKIKYREGLEEVAMPLDAFLAISKNFQGHVEYGIKQTHGGEGGDDTTIYSLAGMPFNDSRDLAEVAGKQLMQKFDSGWMEA